MKNPIRKHSLLLAALMFGVFLAGFRQPVQAQTGGSMKIKLYFPKEDPAADNELVVVERVVVLDTEIGVRLHQVQLGVVDVERRVTFRGFRPVALRRVDVYAVKHDSLFLQ